MTYENYGAPDIRSAMKRATHAVATIGLGGISFVARYAQPGKPDGHKVV